MGNRVWWVLDWVWRVRLSSSAPTLHTYKLQLMQPSDTRHSFMPLTSNLRVYLMLSLKEQLRTHTDNISYTFLHPSFSV